MGSQCHLGTQVDWREACELLMAPEHDDSYRSLVRSQRVYAHHESLRRGCLLVARVLSAAVNANQNVAEWH